MYIYLILLALELNICTLHHRKASLMTEGLKGIIELTPSSSEEDAKNTYDSWASSYEEVS